MDSDNLSLKEWADEDKPREKMLANGKKSLTNAELVAILLRSGCRGMSVVELAKKVLDMAGNSLVDLSRMDVATLRRFKGLGETKAVTLLAALELGYRMQGEQSARKEFYANSSNDIFNYIVASVVDLTHEEFWCIFLNSKLKIVGKQRIASGGINATPVDIRLLFHSAIEHNAVNIALVHNHPTGHLNPSREDKALTKSIIDAGNLLEIKVVDHLIIGLTTGIGPTYYSFRDNGLL